MITREDREQELGMCPCCHHDSEEYLENKRLVGDEEFWDREYAWRFYESGVQDERENKILINVYKF
jgi:hypothetical protein